MKVKLGVARKIVVYGHFAHLSAVFANMASFYEFWQRCGATIVLAPMARQLMRTRGRKAVLNTCVKRAYFELALRRNRADKIVLASIFALVLMMWPVITH